MATAAHPISRRRFAASLLALAATAPSAARASVGGRALVGRDTHQTPTGRPTIEAAFPAQSYAPGSVAPLRLFQAADGVRLTVLRAGDEPARLRGRDEAGGGRPLAAPRWLGRVRAGQTVGVPLGDWPSGLYFVRLDGAAGRVGFAPFVLRPAQPGTRRVAVVLPTLTWQAYNFRDDDGDGTPDTWYAGGGVHTARLARPFENRGVPPHYAVYDAPFLCWLSRSGRHVDYLAQSDVAAVDGATLRRAYDLIVFPGHHEYVTTREYDAVTAFRDRGGSLAFLSANMFFARVDIHDDVMTRVGRWRDLGRPEAALVGIQYIGWDDGRRRGAWIVRPGDASARLFAGTGLGPGSAFSSGGIEIDARAPSSPRSLQVLAEMPEVFGPGMTAQMSYYRTSRGAHVFAAGAFTLAGAVWQPTVTRLVENVWSALAGGQAPLSTAAGCHGDCQRPRLSSSSSR